VEENLYDAVRLAVKLSKMKEKKSPPSEKKTGNRRLYRMKSPPFPNIFTLIHTSPAYRTRSGRIRPAVMTFAIKGQGNRRMRMTRPWREGDPPLEIPTISIGKAKKILREGGLSAYLKNREKLDRYKENLENLENGYEGPSAAFFKE
jgi:hypothetical protein